MEIPNKYVLTLTARYPFSDSLYFVCAELEMTAQQKSVLLAILEKTLRHAVVKCETIDSFAAFELSRTIGKKVTVAQLHQFLMEAENAGNPNKNDKAGKT